VDQGRLMSADSESEWVASFERARPALLGMAYRMLGIRADAEDVVQDVFLRWAAVDRTTIRDPAAWLMRVCSRRSIDTLRSAARSRTDYVGPWLPEPIASGWVQEDRELCYALETAFLLLLERVSPKERAAFLLHDVFGLPHAEVAPILGVTVEASRKLASRAKHNVASERQGHAPSTDRQRVLLAAFEDAILTDDTATLSTLLADDVRLVADGGGKASALREPLHGRTPVLDYLVEARRWWRDYRWSREWTATGPGVALLRGDAVVARIWLEAAAGSLVSSIYVLRNPDKLRPPNT
jgi:RNA polymerase sigma factor (sigma-70 family)